MAIGVGCVKSGAIALFERMMSDLRKEEPRDFSGYPMQGIIDARYNLEENIAGDREDTLFARDSVGGNYFVKDSVDDNYKFNLNAKDERGNTMLILASGSGHLEAVRMLIDGGADVNAMNSDRDTALIAAASWGHLKVTRVLINAGADANVRNVRGETAVTMALMFDPYM